MDTSTFPDKTASTTAGAASEMAGYIGTSAEHVLDATKDAGKQIGTVAKGEMTALREELDSLTSRVSSMSELELADAKERLLKKMESAEAAAHSVAAAVTQQLNHGVDVTTDYVKERPLKSMAVAAGIGLLLGMLISRR
ncbi:MAG: DUF883 domain-containing protein [Polaromonas sp.]|nr:DUF883 domain-containing protein [Polaromonas sp.]